MNLLDQAEMGLNPLPHIFRMRINSAGEIYGPMALSHRYMRPSISMSTIGRGTSSVNDTKCKGVKRP